MHILLMQTLRLARLASSCRAALEEFRVRHSSWLPQTWLHPTSNQQNQIKQGCHVAGWKHVKTLGLLRYLLRSSMSQSFWSRIPTWWIRHPAFRCKDKIFPMKPVVPRGATQVATHRAIEPTQGPRSCARCSWPSSCCSCSADGAPGPLRSVKQSQDSLLFAYI